MFDISPIQILIVLVIALLVFGPRRLPEMGRSIGRGIRELRASLSGDEPPRRAERAAPPPPAAPAPPEHDPVASAPADPAPGGSVEEEEDVLEGVVVPGDRPPGREG